MQEIQISAKYSIDVPSFGLARTRKVEIRLDKSPVLRFHHVSPGPWQDGLDTLNET
jgi:hypothetical protein